MRIGIQGGEVAAYRCDANMTVRSREFHASNCPATRHGKRIFCLSTCHRNTGAEMKVRRHKRPGC